MAPEQVRGQTADARSDIFTLGCLLYEMLAGKRAFARDSATEIMAAILRDPAPEVSVSGVEVTPELNRIVSHCLEKNPGERFQSASDLSFHLKSLLTGTTSMKPRGVRPEENARPETPSIVVLPFDDISPGGDNEYFADGLTEEIIADLSGVQSLRVISRTSAMAFKGTRKDLRTIAGELRVGYVLEGSVRKAGNSLRITAQLIDAAGDEHLWADKYTGTLDDVFDMQERVSRSIVQALKVRLSPVEAKQMAKRPIANVAAYDYYLRARSALLSFSTKGVAEAIDLLEAGLKVVGENALFYAGLGYAHMISFMAEAAKEEALNKAVEYGERAMRLDPELAQVHVLMGIIETSRNAVKAVSCLKQALAIDPGNYDAYFWLTKAYWIVGRCSAALATIDRLIELDPLNPMHLGMRSDVNFYDGSVDLAIEDMAPIWTANPGNPLFRFWSAFLLAHADRMEEALSALDPIESVAVPDFWTQVSRVFKHAIQADRAGVLAHLTPDMAAAARLDGMMACYLASMFAMLDDFVQALDFLEHAVNRGFINYPYLNRHDRFLAKMHGDPRFEKLMQRVKREWEEFEA